MITFTADQIAQATIQSVESNSVNESRSGLRYVRNNQTQRFAGNLTFVRMTNEQIKALYAKLVSLRGQLGTAKIELPFVHSHPNVTGTITVNGTFAAGVSDVTIGGSYVGALSIGGMINFAGHDKAYMVTGLSGTTMTIAPALRKAVSNDAVNFTAPYILAYMDGDESEWQTSRAVSQLKAKFIEELS